MESLDFAEAMERVASCLCDDVVELAARLEEDIRRNAELFVQRCLLLVLQLLLFHLSSEFVLHILARVTL